jgi:hypothetical protein
VSAFRCGILDGMSAVLHRVEALPGEGRYAVTFQLGNGGEQTAVVQLGNGTVDVAEASLPTGWTPVSEQFVAAVGVLRAFDGARLAARGDGSVRVLGDVDGGWDVSLGNVALDEGGRPVCAAHGELEPAGDRYRCPECGAQARLD